MKAISHNMHSIVTRVCTLVSLLFIMAACSEPSKPNNGGASTTTPSDTDTLTVQAPIVRTKIVWTHTDGSTHYADTPANGILLGSALTATKADIRSVDTIPSSVTTIGGGAFGSSTSLTKITIPSSVTTIGGGAFTGCTSLTKITIPSSVTTIGNGVFANGSALTSVRVEATTPPTAGTNMFFNTHASLSITVPSASVDAYKAAAGWSTYAGRITGY